MKISLKKTLTLGIEANSVKLENSAISNVCSILKAKINISVDFRATALTMSVQLPQNVQ